MHPLIQETIYLVRRAKYFIPGDPTKYLIEEFGKVPATATGLAPILTAYAVLNHSLPHDAEKYFPAAVAHIRAVVAFLKTPDYMAHTTKQSLQGQWDTESFRVTMDRILKIQKGYQPFSELSLPQNPEISNYNPKSIKVKSRNGIEGDAKGVGTIPKGSSSKRKIYSMFSENPARVWAKR